VCPENDIFEPYYRLQNNLITITVVGLLLLLFFSVFIIRYNLRPLKRLGASAEKMSEGDFHVSVPDSKRRDEIGQLQRSFSKMQRSLSEYINKIHHSTETLTERNEELLRASELAKEDDRIKTAVINNMTDQMVHPVDVIAHESDLIRLEYKNYSEEEMAQHVDRMLASTDDVTNLLNQLLEASQGNVDMQTNAPSADTKPQEGLAESSLSRT
jgi:methyl-accepting chemotaxis protein